ncbi:helix-turn-helix transcriptional regulator [Streptomyces sp. NBC_00669]|uniref:helix-turn-helix transcriptional regulator n=1 Tax=unclassified Streptomyces TaxID=2593676 RepID=UPI002E37C68C|nr:helix-turn-helix transcriptional regulator [Streptomyces sp. NBC_00669]
MNDRQAMRNLLARARARQDPAALGLAPRAEPRGRKVEGLTHEHMTRLLGWPEHKYGYVERGRLAVIDTEILEPIARILCLTEQEWESLVLYATGTPPAFPLDPQVGRSVPRPWRRVLAGSRDIAYVSDAAWDLVAYNSAFARLFTPHGVPGNVMRWMLLAPAARVTLADWANSWLPLLVPQLRAAATARPNDKTLQRLIADIRRDPVVGPCYDAPTTEYLQPRAEGARPLLHPELGPGWATMCAAGPFGVPGGRLMFVLFDRGERPGPQEPMHAPATTGPVDLDTGPDSGPGRSAGPGSDPGPAYVG